MAFLINNLYIFSVHIGNDANTMILDFLQTITKSISNIKIGDLKPGSWRHLTGKEKAQLLNRAGLGNS